MVQLTSILSKYKPPWMYFFNRCVFMRKQAVYRLTYAQKGRKRNCWKRAQQNLYVKYREEIEQRRKDKFFHRHLNSARIIAACDEHNYKFSDFVTRLPMVGISINSINS